VIPFPPSVEVNNLAGYLRPGILFFTRTVGGYQGFGLCTIVRTINSGERLDEYPQKENLRDFQ
jgi:hypothetical protein